MSELRYHERNATLFCSRQLITFQNIYHEKSISTKLKIEAWVVGSSVFQMKYLVNWVIPLLTGDLIASLLRILCDN